MAEVTQSDVERLEEEAREAVMRWMEAYHIAVGNSPWCDDCVKDVLAEAVDKAVATCQYHAGFYDGVQSVVGL